MGIFSKKKTTVENISTTIVESKIVKLSYIQTLAIDGGLGNIHDLAGETEATTETTEGSQSKNRKAIEKFSQLATAALGPAGAWLGGVANSLFGKKVTKSTKIEIQDSGWSVTKMWNQPQFDVIRYALGIKELTVAQFTYTPVSEIVSKPWTSPKEIIKVTLFVDQFIPREFPPGTHYIEYYIKPGDENTEWIRINPLGLPSTFTPEGSIIPRIISFNTEKPVNARLEESYITTSSPVRSLRFKAILKRPETIQGAAGVSANAYTPILKSYKMIMTPRGGL